MGVGLALMLAPGSGSETRRRLGRGLRSVGRRGRNAWEDLQDELRRARRQLRRARRLKREVAGEVDEVADEVADALPGS